MPQSCCDHFSPIRPNRLKRERVMVARSLPVTPWLSTRQDSARTSTYFTPSGYHVRYRRRSGSMSLSSLDIFRSSRRLAQPLAYLRKVGRSLHFRSELNRWEEVRPACAVLRKWTADRTIKVRIVACEQQLCSPRRGVSHLAGPDQGKPP